MSKSGELEEEISPSGATSILIMGGSFYRKENNSGAAKQEAAQHNTSEHAKGD